MVTAEEAGKAKDALNGQPFQGKALVIDLARTEQRDRPMGGSGERRERPAGAGEFRPRREGNGGWGGDRGGDRREQREPRGDRGGYNRY